MADMNQEYPTTLGPDTVFKGQLQFEKGVRLLGKFDGEITSEGQLLIADGASLNGDVKAGAIRIEGQVKGNLNAATKVQLSASARLEGDLQTARLEVAEGAVLIGRCVVGTNGQAAKPGETRPTYKPVETVKPRPGESTAPTMNQGQPATVKK